MGVAEGVSVANRIASAEQNNNNTTVRRLDIGVHEGDARGIRKDVCMTWGGSWRWAELHKPKDQEVHLGLVALLGGDVNHINHSDTTSVNVEHKRNAIHKAEGCWLVSG